MLHASGGLEVSGFTVPYIQILKNPHAEMDGLTPMQEASERSCTFSFSGCIRMSGQDGLRIPKRKPGETTKNNPPSKGPQLTGQRRRLCTLNMRHAPRPHNSTEVTGPTLPILHCQCVAMTTPACPKKCHQKVESPGLQGRRSSISIN